MSDTRHIIGHLGDKSNMADTSWLTHICYIMIRGTMQFHNGNILLNLISVCEITQ